MDRPLSPETFTYSAHLTDDHIAGWQRGSVSPSSASVTRADKRKVDRLDNGGGERRRTEQIKIASDAIQPLSDEKIEELKARKRDVEELMTEPVMDFYSSATVPSEPREDDLSILLEILARTYDRIGLKKLLPSDPIIAILSAGTLESRWLIDYLLRLAVDPLAPLIIHPALVKGSGPEVDGHMTHYARKSLTTVGALLDLVAVMRREVPSGMPKYDAIEFMLAGRDRSSPVAELYVGCTIASTADGRAEDDAVSEQKGGFSNRLAYPNDFQPSFIPALSFKLPITETPSHGPLSAQQLHLANPSSWTIEQALIAIVTFAAWNWDTGGAGEVNHVIPFQEKMEEVRARFPVPSVIPRPNNLDSRRIKVEEHVQASSDAAEELGMDVLVPSSLTVTKKLASSFRPVSSTDDELGSVSVTIGKDITKADAKGESEWLGEIQGRSPRLHQAIYDLVFFGASFFSLVLQLIDLHAFVLTVSIRYGAFIDFWSITTCHDYYWFSCLFLGGYLELVHPRVGFFESSQGSYTAHCGHLLHGDNETSTSFSNTPSLSNAMKLARHLKLEELEARPFDRYIENHLGELEVVPYGKDHWMVGLFFEDAGYVKYNSILKPLHLKIQTMCSLFALVATSLACDASTVTDPGSKVDAEALLKKLEAGLLEMGLRQMMKELIAQTAPLVSALESLKSLRYQDTSTVTTRYEGYSETFSASKAKTLALEIVAHGDSSSQERENQKRAMLDGRIKPCCPAGVEIYSTEWDGWFFNVPIGKSYQQSANASIAAVPEKKEASDQNLVNARTALTKKHDQKKLSSSFSEVSSFQEIIANNFVDLDKLSPALVRYKKYAVVCESCDAVGMKTNRKCNHTCPVKETKTTPIPKHGFIATPIFYPLQLARDKNFDAILESTLSESTLFKVERTSSPSSSSSSSSSSTANSNIISIILASQEDHPLAPLYLASARSLAATSPDMTKEQLAQIAEETFLEYVGKDEVIDVVGGKKGPRKRDQEDEDDSDPPRPTKKKKDSTEQLESSKGKGKEKAFSKPKSKSKGNDGSRSKKKGKT